MKFDICCCTYNSSRWLKSFFDAMCAVDYDKKKLSLYFTDNGSKDDTVKQLEAYKAKLSSVFGEIKILRSQVNQGFGAASNQSARAGKSEYVFFYNVDTAIYPDAFCELEKAILAADEKVQAFEMRQFPHEHPKYYDPVTLRTDWASGAVFILTRKLFELTGGFDESIFMYCEDVDLSWRIRLAGFEIQYVPKAISAHFTAEDISQMKPTQIAGQLAGEKVLRLKFGDAVRVKEWDEYRGLFEKFLQESDSVRQLSEKLLAQVEKHKNEYRHFYKTHVKNSAFKPNFEAGYTFHRTGALYKNYLPSLQPAISVIVRTCGRPDVLHLTLASLCNQTYSNFKVIVVEDGEVPVSESTVRAFANRLNIEYLPLKEKAGRCKAGNVGLQQANTRYVCFLDDDDYWFADFLEVNACLIEQNPNCKMFCSASVEAATRKQNASGSQFVFENKRNLQADGLGRVDFYAGNPVPIQAVLFEKELFEQYGGFDPALDAFEDWELWIRYATHCEIASVNKSLSIFRVPAEKAQIIRRNAAMEPYREVVYQKLSEYSATFTAQEIRSLFWKPECAQTDAEKDFEQLVASAQAIQASSVWRVMQPLRKILAAFCRAASKGAVWVQGLENIVGPSLSQDQWEDYGALQKFVMKTRESWLMKSWHAVSNGVKGRK